MARANATKVTMESVHAAVDQLRQSGQTPTVRTVSMLIGGGSYPLIAAFLKQVRAEAAEATPAVELPTFWGDAVAKLVEHVRSSVESAVTLEVEQLRADLDSFTNQCRELEGELNQKIEQAEALSKELAEERARCAMLEQKTEREAAAHMEAVRMAAATSAERDIFAEEINRLTTACVQMKTKAVSEATTRIELERMAAAAMAEREVYRAETERLRADLDAARMAIADARVESVRLQQGIGDRAE